MIVSEMRVAANRRNALKSTGPKTVEGKERSRLNSLKHGLCSSIVVVEDGPTVARRMDQYFQTLKPQNDFHCWCVSEIAVYSCRIDRAERMERRIRDKMAMKAELTWDDDRRLDAIMLGHTLGNRPDMVVEQLRRTVQGCEWLMSRWAMLKHVADVDKKWTPGQTSLAFDLLGTPADFRVGRKPETSLDFDGNVFGSADDLASLATREINALKERREIVAPLDEVNRALAMADLGDDSAEPELRKLRRHEATLHSRLHWFLRQLQFQAPFTEPMRGLRRAWVGDPEIAPPTDERKTPEPHPIPPIVVDPVPLTKFDHPPFDLEPDEFPGLDEVADIPQILRNRTEKKLKKADARRNAKRRKVEKLRA